MAHWRTLGFLVVVVWSVAVGCEKSDVGTCCQVLPGRPMELIPVPMQTDKGEWIDDISLDPAFDCENLTCVSYQGSNAYCTQKCEFKENCPDEFDCVPVIASDPGPDSNIGPNDKFCVRPMLQYSCEE
jgi:hypothetical protein